MYTVYMEMKPNYGIKYIYCDRMCVVLVVYQFLFSNFPSKLHTVFYTVKMTRCLLAFHIYTQLTNIKLQTQFFTTLTLLQFCVSKSPPL